MKKLASTKIEDHSPIDLKNDENPEIYDDKDMGYDEPQEYVYIDSHSIHLIKILIRNRNILKEIINEKDNEIEQLKAKIEECEGIYRSVANPEPLQKEEVKQAPNEDIQIHIEDEVIGDPQLEEGKNAELLNHLEKAERMVEHYKELLVDLHSTYNFPDEILDEFEVDANAILEKSFKQPEPELYGDDMDTDPNNILDTSYDEPFPLKDSSLNVNYPPFITLFSIGEPCKT